MKKKSPLATLGSVLKDMAHDLHLEDKMEQVMLYRLWREAVGDAVARNASPALVRRGVLHVNVSSSVWVQQLHFLRDMVLEKINAKLTGEKIIDIRFKVGPVTAPQEQEEGSPLPELAPGEQKAIEAEADKIPDPEMRESFRAFMATYIKSHKPEK